MMIPTPKQIEIRDTAALGLLVVAPAGCGKTEALALRVQGLVRRGIVKPPHKALVVTFSNRARDNIKDRLRSYLTASEMSSSVTVVNFHGLSARLFRAHSNIIGHDPDEVLPESDWVGDEIRRLDLAWGQKILVRTALREVKQEGLTDDEVEKRLSGPVLSIELERRRERRLTYDDLLRFAELILENDAVADLYRAHFAAVIVDEFQDLTLQQLRIVNRLGRERTTYAGDVAQGIYGFAGARPVEVDRAIRAECGTVIELRESHRSSPAVHSTVNSLTGLTGGRGLVAADPESWPGGGLAAFVPHDTAGKEATYVVALAEGILSRVPTSRIGVMSRSAGRRRFVDSAFMDSVIQPHRWDDGILDTETAKIVKGMLSSFDLAAFKAAPDQVSFLREAAAFDAVTDGRDSLASALSWCYDLLHDGLEPSEVGARIRIGNSSTLVTIPGVHLLTGHVGKGQQFDWVIIVGLEDGSIPNFNAKSPAEVAEEARVLSVMISRARHGVVMNCAHYVPTMKGVLRSQEPSRFYQALRDARLLDARGVKDWLGCVDWNRIALR